MKKTFTIFNESLKESIEILFFDSKKEYALICMTERIFKRYIVVFSLDFDDGSWSQGHYFNSLDNAYEYYQEKIA